MNNRPLLVYASFAMSTTGPNKLWVLYLDTQPRIKLVLAYAPVRCKPLDPTAMCVHFTHIWIKEPIR